ncbi:hypothetical protein AQUCO_02000002v1 [Aquilegia coerulea]|uniref:Uncharacterized protein n=1 Tax=Aquilegia coerulea TaxID=218851 RepID=A0A2G5DFE0_AQUCA|nr:hypothetical protein AQUCO_02000002v1 [Aquilegia coerulea]
MERLFLEYSNRSGGLYHTMLVLAIISARQHQETISISRKFDPDLPKHNNLLRCYLTREDYNYQAEKAREVEVQGFYNVNVRSAI